MAFNPQSIIARIQDYCTRAAIAHMRRLKADLARRLEREAQQDDSPRALLAAVRNLRANWLDQATLMRAMLAAHAVGITEATLIQEKELRFAEDDLSARVWYRDALESFARKKVINAAEMERILDALPKARLLGRITDPDDTPVRHAYKSAFTMVREANQQIIERVKGLVESAIRNNQTAADFIHDTNDLYRKMGLRDQDPWYSNLVYNNATNRAHQEGVEITAREMDEIGNLWGYRWMHSGKTHFRPAHKALDGFSAPKDDPRWQQIGTPPIGHNCGCRRIPVTQGEARRRNLDSTPPTPKIRGGQYHGMTALDGLRQIPGERFPRSRYNIEKRPLLNPSYFNKDGGGTPPPVIPPTPKPAPVAPPPSKPVVAPKPKAIKKPAAPPPPADAKTKPVAQALDAVETSFKELVETGKKRREKLARVEQAAKAHYKRYTDQIGQLTNRFIELNDKEGPPLGPIEDQKRFITDSVHSISKRVDKIQANLMKIRKEREDLTAKVLNPEKKSPIVNVKIRATAIKSDKTRREALNSGVEFVRSVTSDKWTIGDLPVLATRGSRAYCNPSGIALSKFSRSSTVVHEIGHWVENHNRAIGNRAREFLKHRAGSESPVTLRSLFPGHGYSSSERAYKDRFKHPYAGKVYASGHTEIISMGIQHLHELGIDEFATQDYEYCKFTVSVLKGWIA